jgi:hypothetical protein
MNIHDLYKHIFRHWRMQRFRAFVELIQTNRQMRVLDVGGYPSTWTAHQPVVGSITCLNIHPVEWDPASFPDHNIQTVVGNGCNLDFSDDSFDIVFSNSVIEHVGSFENQQAFASELRRVGKRLWVQTPAYECPIEPHYLAPFVHWFPQRIQKKILRRMTPWGLMQKPSAATVEEMVNTTRLMTHTEVERLFPDCAIIVEKMAGFIPKSYVAIRKGNFDLK